MGRLRARGLLVLALLPVSGCEVGSERQGFDWERMIEQERYDAYEPSTEFPDGKVMRTPPEGTVPRERALEPAAVATGLEAGRPVERIPLPVTETLLARGQERFGIFCAVCHGAAGLGRSAVGRAMTLAPPPPLHGPRLREASDGHLFRVVTEGYGLMPSYARQLDARERWAVVAYVRALQLSQGADLDLLPGDVREEALRRLDLPDGEGGP